jgi:16S rRNA (uracil1498-N3)-methyltransferase
VSGIECVLHEAGDAGPEIGGEIVLTAEESHHAVRVRRLRAGDPVWAVSGTGTAWRCRLEEADPREARLQVFEAVPRWREPEREVRLYQGLIRSAHLEQIVEQGTAIGMTRLTPLITDRVERHGARTDRLRRIAREAVKQCGRGLIPDVDDPLPWEAFLSQRGDDLLLVADSEAETGLARFISSSRLPETGTIGVVIGPEGGLTPAEMEALTATGAVPVHLGDRRLRSETAAAAALSLLLIGTL